MNGPEHYREAEEVLRIIASGEAATETQEDRAAVIAIAQVHATLALAAATAMAGRSTRGRSYVETGDGLPAGMHPRDFTAWDEAAGVSA